VPAGRTKAEFHGVFDSRSHIIPADKLANAPPDEAFFEPLESSRTLESGRMMNPDRDWAVEAYEEIWVDEDLDEDAPCLMLHSLSNDAFLGRVGKWQIGLLKEGTTYYGARWELEGGRWKLVYSTANESRLAPLPTDGLDVRDGQQVEFDGRTWIVDEKSGGGKIP
jgi:hypothetical protein